MAYHQQNWDTVLNLINVRRINNSEKSTLIKLLEISATWQLGKPINFGDLSGYGFPVETQTRIFDMFFNSNPGTFRNRSIDIHEEMIRNNHFDMMADGQELIDKIVCAAHLDERDLIEMWYSVRLFTFREI